MGGGFAIVSGGGGPEIGMVQEIRGARALEDVSQSVKPVYLNSQALLRLSSVKQQQKQVDN